jgi:integrase
MPRPPRDGSQARRPSKRKFTDNFIEKLKVDRARHFLVWDEKVCGLAITVYPSGSKVFKVIYRQGPRLRWYTIGKFGRLDLDAARKLGSEILLRVAGGGDPQAEKMAGRERNTFTELYERYLIEAKKKLKSWDQKDYCIRTHVLPKLGKLKASEITRADVKSLLGSISSTSVASQTKDHLSSVFTYGVKEEVITSNPCKLIDGEKRSDRSRVLSDSEVQLFWKAFDDAGIRGTALKFMLLTGQRPGEVQHLRKEHIADGWWLMPGRPVEELNWPGTKNGGDHRVWIPRIALDMLNSLDGPQPFIMAADEGPRADTMRAICKRLKIADKVTPHDLRRSHGSRVCELGFSEDLMDRIENHRKPGVTRTYNRHRYDKEIKEAMEAVAAMITSLVEGTQPNVIGIPRKRA